MTDIPALVSTNWLFNHRHDPNLKIADASYFIVGGAEKARALYDDAHIPGAVFFDINQIADKSKPKDHAFPTAEIFARSVGGMGIGNDDHIVIYDRSGGTAAAARAWYMFRAFGHDKVSLLDGGFENWQAEKRPLTNDKTHLAPRSFFARDLPGKTVSKDDMLANITTRRFQVLDARSKGRFEGTEAEPRQGLRAGHIPASRNLPSAHLIDAANKTWKDPEALQRSFREAGIDLAGPLSTTCGSGVTACALAFGAFLAGKPDTIIYDGSWVEWGADPNLPLETGA